jgi:hypothetical protein
VPPGITAVGDIDEMEFSGVPTTAGDYTITLTVGDQDGDEVIGTFNVMVVTVLDLTGTWSVRAEAIVEPIGCAADVGDTGTYSVAIMQTGTSNDAPTTVVGVPGAWFFRRGLQMATNQATGQLNFTNRVVLDVQGSWPEENGTTETHHIWTVMKPDSLVGMDLFSWNPNEVIHCDSRTAKVSAKKTGP